MTREQLEALLSTASHAEVLAKESGDALAGFYALQLRYRAHAMLHREITKQVTP
jgi:hypothetical protein